jgi:large repetitive protein
LLEANDSLLVTWTAASGNGIASQTVAVDGKLLKTRISGPSSGARYSCTISAQDVGNHTLTITAVDKRGTGYSATYNFTVVAPIAPTIAAAAVVEAAAGNGTLESSDKLKMRWTAASSNGIASQIVTVDGKTITPITHGSGPNYSSTIGAWSAGTHNYVITATDAKGTSANFSGTFSVAATPAATPTITGVSVAEAIATSDAALMSNQPLVIGWKTTSANKLRSQSVTIDGRLVGAISRQNASSLYSSTIGAWSAGAHTYTIVATDAKGLSASLSGTFEVVAAVVTPLLITHATVAETYPATNSALEPGELLTILWSTGTSLNGIAIASQTITIDGRKVASLAGSGKKTDYSSAIGAWSAGAHNYVITTTSATGFTFNYFGTFMVTASDEA